MRAREMESLLVMAGVSQVLRIAVAHDAVLCTDGSNFLAAVAKALGLEHQAVDVQSGQRVRGAWRIQNVNAHHSRFKEWMRRFKGVATSYLPNYLGWFRALNRNARSAAKPAPLLALAVGCIGTSSANANGGLKSLSCVEQTAAVLREMGSHVPTVPRSPTTRPTPAPWHRSTSTSTCASTTCAHIKVAEVPPGPPVLAPIVAEIYGPEAAGRQQVAKAVRAVFERRPGVVGVDDSSLATAPKTVLIVDRQKAAMPGFSQQAIVTTLRAGRAGEAMAYLHDETNYPAAAAIQRRPARWTVRSTVSSRCAARS